MKPETISMMAAAISALAAVFSIYMYRSQGKGFIWAKDPKVQLGILPDQTMQLIVEIPLYNFGLGNLRFLSLKAKRIHLKNNSIENYKLDMDEAYFPPGVSIISYKTPVHVEPGDEAAAKKGNYIEIFDPSKITTADAATIQESINKKVEAVGEVLFVLHCVYKDGSWFGLSKKSTTIAMSLNKLDLNYISVARRKELKELFS